MGKVLAIREVGDPILAQKCKKAKLKEIREGKYKEICDDLVETLEFSDAYGLACPQVGQDLCLIAVKAKKEEVKYDDPQDIPLTLMFNPKWRPLSKEQDVQFEACVSVPQVAGKVKRYKHIEVQYYDEDGEKITRTVHGFFARLVQHECDHLKGIVFLNRVKTCFATKDMIKKFNLRDGSE